jgi:hypothetical protein
LKAENEALGEEVKKLKDQATTDHAHFESLAKAMDNLAVWVETAMDADSSRAEITRQTRRAGPDLS